MKFCFVFLMKQLLNYTSDMDTKTSNAKILYHSSVYKPLISPVTKWIASTGIIVIYIIKILGLVMPLLAFDSMLMHTVFRTQAA
jgi:hypothetical protein